MKYQVTMYYPDGESESDELFDTWDEAEEYALYQMSCYKLGGEILNMSNPGDYPLSDDEDDISYGISEIEDD